MMTNKTLYEMRDETLHTDDMMVNETLHEMRDGTLHTDDMTNETLYEMRDENLAHRGLLFGNCFKKESFFKEFLSLFLE